MGLQRHQMDPTTPQSDCSELRAALDKLKASAADGYGVAIKTMLIFINNVKNHPQDEKFRKIQLSNKAFHTRVGSHVGGIDALLCIGFKMNETNDALVLTPNAEAWEMLVASAELLETETTSINSPQPAVPLNTSGMPSDTAASMEQMMSNPNLANMMNKMAPMLQQVAQNPQLLQQALQNPMLQQMAASNPVMQQMMSNPAGLQSMLSSPMAQQFLQNPRAMQQMMQGAGGQPGMMPAADPSAAPAAAPNGMQATELAPSGMSEEEMLAQAIQASLTQDPNRPSQ